jgi:MFS family permease
MAFMQLPGQIGPLLGPPVGGLITTYLSWQWVFLVNLPIGLAGVLLATVFIENARETTTRPFDWTGFVLTGISLSCLLDALEALSRPTATPMEIVAAAVIGTGTGAWSLIHARRHGDPLMDLGLFAIPTFRVNMTAGTLFRIATDGLPFMLPLMFQVALGMTAFASGLLIFASAVGSIIVRMIARPLLRRFGFRRALIVNGVISAITLLSCALFTRSMPALLIMAILLLGGFFRAFQFISMSTLAYADIEPSKMSSATSLSSMCQQLCNGFGVALAALILNSCLALRHETSPSVGDFQIAYCLTAILALSSIPLFRPLPPDAGTEISGHLPRSRFAGAATQDE